MRIQLVALGIVVASVALAGEEVQQDVTRGSGGPMARKDGMGDAMNEGASLEIDWLAVHHTGLPCDLVGSPGAISDYVGTAYSPGGYGWRAEFELKTSADLVAVEVTFVTFDVWRDPGPVLSFSEVVDIKAGSTKKFQAKWAGRRGRAIDEHQTSIAFVSRVRTKAGEVLVADHATVLKTARSVSSSVTERNLVPERDEDRPK